MNAPGCLCFFAFLLAVVPATAHMDVRCVRAVPEHPGTHLWLGPQSRTIGFQFSDLAARAQAMPSRHSM